MWLIVEDIIKDKKFDTQEQEKFKTLFGISSLNKMKNFLSNIDNTKIEEAIINKVINSQNDLKELLPISFDKELDKLKSKVNFLITS